MDNLTVDMKKYGVMVDGYFVKGFKKGVLTLGDGFYDLLCIEDKKRVVEVIKALKKQHPDHEYKLVSISVETELQ